MGRSDKRAAAARATHRTPGIPDDYVGGRPITEILPG